MNNLAANLRKLRLEKGMTQEQSSAKLGVSAQSVSRWETGATLPDVMLLPEIARLYGVLVDDLFKPSPKGYDNNALRLLAVYERTSKPEDFLAAAQEFEKLIRTNSATAEDWRSYGVIHEYMATDSIKKALSCYDRALEMSITDDPAIFHRTQRQKIQLRCHIGQAEACIREQEVFAQEHADNAQAWVDLAHAHFFANQPEAALNICRTALQKFPEEGLLHVYAGDSLRALKQYEEAFPHWEAAVAISTDFLDAMYSMAFCRGDMGQFDKAAAVWENIARLLDARGLEIEAQWPREMAAKCREQLK